MQISRPPASRPALRALLIDISGILHVGSAVTSNAVEAFRRLQESGVPFRLCSNTSKESTRDVAVRLRKLGFDLRESSHAGDEGPREVWTSIGAVRRVMQDMDIHSPRSTQSRSCLLSDSARTELQLVPPEKEKDNEDEDQRPFDHDAVIVGLCPATSTTRISTPPSASLLESTLRGLPVSPSSSPRTPTRVLEAPTGGLALGPGPFPLRAFFEAVIADVDAHGCVAAPRNPDVPAPPNSRVAIIGDDVEADLGGGTVELGLWRVLARTGKYRPGDETRTSSPPDEVVDSFAAFVDSFLSGSDMTEKSLDMDPR
ncbi:Haloacid dehalogenase-like hydrolase domain-containing protein 2 [Mycena sanguinolenta]|uniref:Haloacid dehalogenase-like hydrolase domain-containing protein 2 n=1 Tax=Mycena sanguinolenta TaxID=230812 RepID=A0A8H6Y4E8_9AGAR|nr:Haloacid dehalogenase-like hydrolase domain-containing protein 2 [Mycena sanguinolenta]